MNLVQFIDLLQQGASIEQVIVNHSALPDAEGIGVYMANKVGLASQLAFFDLESVPPYLLITVDGQQYEAFFPVAELADLIPEYAAFLGVAASPQTIAEALLHYHEYDA
jgi:hypothetical protein